MARYQISRSCGHLETIELFGNRRERDRRAKWEEDQERLCRECWQEERNREREEEHQAAAEAAEREGLPELQGSPKQVAWAETIRHDLLAQMKEFVDGLPPAQAWHGGERAPDGDEPATEGSVQRAVARTEAEAGRAALAALREVSAARWFIDNRHSSVPKLVGLARRGELAPRTAEQEAAGFDPNGYSTFTLPRGEVRITPDGDVVVTLRGSRWEGCTFTHPAALTTVHTGTTGTGDDTEQGAGVVELRFHGGWSFMVSDGRRAGRVTAQEMHTDRTTGRREPGPRRYLLPAPWRPGAWNEIDVPEADVEEETRTIFGERLTGYVRVMLRHSRWEGLYLHHRRRLVVRHRPGYVTLLVPPGVTHVRLDGGVERTAVPAAEFAEDRARPLDRPGASLAVPQERWHRVVFDPSRIRRVKDASMVRFGWETQDPKAVVFHPWTMCRTREDGTVVWHFPDRWEFRLRLPEGGTRTLSATDFVEVTASWARTEPTPGTHRRVPEPLDPVVAEVDPELLDDDLGIPEEWDIDDAWQDDGDDQPGPDGIDGIDGTVAGAAEHETGEQERNAEQ
ncbi:hypothetical protein [Streptomyces sp. NPDC058861]|uniref:hypothetical protein n=1 Tax=Streptomyces sp. NPDC058861 TaxID=3346653 RepID=UPI0036CD5898